jgi:flagellar motor switch protein FliN
MPATDTPTSTLSGFAEATHTALQDVLSQALSPDWKVEVASPDVPPIEPENSACIGLLVTGVVSGQAALLLSRADAALLGRAFVGDTSDAPAEYGDEQREAVEELIRQVFGLATTALQANLGQLWIEVDPAVSVAEPAQRNAFVLTSGSKPPLVCELLMSSELTGSFTAASQKLPEEAAGDGPEPSPATATPSPAKASPPPEPAIEDLSLLAGVEVEVTLRFGHRWLPLRDIVNLASGSVVELEESLAEPVEVVVGDRVLARGEIVSVDGCYGVRIVETASPHQARP